MKFTIATCRIAPLDAVLLYRRLLCLFTDTDTNRKEI